MFCPKSVWKKYKIKRIRSDNCTEYVNHELSKYVSLNTHMYRNGVLFQECLRYFKSSLIHCLAKSQFEKKKKKENETESVNHELSKFLSLKTHMYQYRVLFSRTFSGVHPKYWTRTYMVHFQINFRNTCASKINH